MTVESHRLKLQTHREGEIQDITEKVQGLLDNSKIRSGIAVLFVPGSTAALTTIEYEPGLVHDFPAMLNRIIPSNIPYEHEKHDTAKNAGQKLVSLAEKIIMKAK